MEQLKLTFVCRDICVGASSVTAKFHCRPNTFLTVIAYKSGIMLSKIAMTFQ